MFDVSALVAAAIRSDSVPERTSRHALLTDQVAIFGVGAAELLDVLPSFGLARFLDPER